MFIVESPSRISLITHSREIAEQVCFWMNHYSSFVQYTIHLVEV